MRLTVTENQRAEGMLVIVYDENDQNYAELNESDLNALYLNGILSERFGSYKFKEQVKTFVKGN